MRNDRDLWLDSMKSEYNSLMTKKTWILADKPEDVPIVKNKWVFVMKKNKDGNIERYKSSLVAKGCSQRYGVGSSCIVNYYC